MRERFCSDPPNWAEQKHRPSDRHTEPGPLQPKADGLAFPIWSYLSCYPARFMASPLHKPTRLSPGGAPLHDRFEITLVVRGCRDIFQTAQGGLYEQFLKLPWDVMRHGKGARPDG